MRRREFLKGLSNAAVVVAAAAITACLIHLAWVVAALVTYCVLVLAGLICGYVPDTSIAPQILNLTVALLTIIFGVYGIVFIAAMLWSCVFIDKEDIKK